MISQAATSPNPAPSAGPLTAAITGLAHSGQDRDPNVVAVGEAVEGGDQLLTELGILGVHRRTVHCNGGDEVLNGDLDEVGHVRVP
jgi:hypothetical protein